ncbi:zinc ribbon domain-containing protein [Palleronia rufa]|uniref:zinc ribbon domain-containing protein n=1 Tax=Palleronia rufa TaxID=1530186 RepID=UPI0009DE6445
MRGFVNCQACGNAMTAAWSKGKYRRYAYYRCVTRNCDAKGKSVAKAKLEAGFEQIMQSLAPSRQLVELAGAMLADAWSHREEKALSDQRAWQAQIKQTEKQIEDLLDRIVDAERESVIKAYEKRLDKLERQKIVLAEKASKALPTNKAQRECIEQALGFLANPYYVYKNGSHAVKQTVLRLVFVEPLNYCRENQYGTPEISFPFKVLGGSACAKKMVVPPERFELPTS